MAKIKRVRESGITPNILLYDPNISLKAKGLYAYIEAKPDDWDFAAVRIAAETKDGRDGIQAGLHELEEAGYLHREQKKNKNGQWEVEYTLYALPHSTATDYPSRGEDGTEQENPSPSVTENTVRTVPDSPSTENPSSKKVLSKDNTRYTITPKGVSDSDESQPQNGKEKIQNNAESEDSTITLILDFLKKYIGVEDFKEDKKSQRA